MSGRANIVGYNKDVMGELSLFFKNNFTENLSGRRKSAHGVFADMYLENHSIYQYILKSSCLERHVVNRLKLPNIVCKHFVRKQNHTGNSFEKYFNDESY